MSYRSFKHLLGETSLERKCRFIFGLGIFVLVTVSFLWYGLKTEELVNKQTMRLARTQVRPALVSIHYKVLNNVVFTDVLNVLMGGWTPLEDLPGAKAVILNPYDAKKQPRDDFEHKAIEEFLKAAEDRTTPPKVGDSREPTPFTFPNGKPMWVARAMPGGNQYQYIQAVTFNPSCLIACHSNDPRDELGGDAFDLGRIDLDNHYFRPARDGRGSERVKAGDLAGAVAVHIPLELTRKEINSNRAMLITAALVTAILAMVSSYMIVRYIIVKPVKHLRDVSDAIAAGRLNIRSQIQTGDEFEDLSHAFNRMLHNLVAMQQELRDVNSDLDHKVDELAQANMALYEMNRIKSDFLATMSHELRTPLNSIIGFSEVLGGDGHLSDRQRRYAGNIQTSGKMLLNMINDILDLAKIESGKMEVRGEDFSIRDVGEAVTNLARPMADRKDITLECRLDDAIPLLRQDPGKIRQILYNLLSNAIKFTPEGGRVTVGARAEGRFLVLEVEDTGIGIAEEDRETIFEKFRQATPGRDGNVLTREHEGTGLGLSIVRELASLLGGEIGLKSQPGRGSVFTVRIPLQLPGNRRFEVNLSDERVDLSKARRIDPQPAFPHPATNRPWPNGAGVDPTRGQDKNAPVG